MIRVVAIGRIKEKEMQSLIKEYEKRIKPIHTVEIIELNNSNKDDVVGIVEDESKRILERLNDKMYVILLDLKGKDETSPQMSQRLIQQIDVGKDVTFIIGGSHGVSDDVRKRADFRWRISNLTFPHQLVRVMLMEQIYRMFMIAKNHPYHK